MNGRDTLERYFDAMRSHDWPALADCLSEGVERVGPYLDRVSGRAAYAAFLEGIVPTLPNYTLTITAIHEIDSRRAFVELSETLDVDGIATEFPEALFFAFDGEGRIAEVSVYIKQPPKKQ